MNWQQANLDFTINKMYEYISKIVIQIIKRPQMSKLNN